MVPSPSINPRMRCRCRFDGVISRIAVWPKRLNSCQLAASNGSTRRFEVIERRYAFLSGRYFMGCVLQSQVRSISRCCRSRSCKVQRNCLALEKRPVQLIAPSANKKPSQYAVDSQLMPWKAASLTVNLRRACEVVRRFTPCFRRRYKTARFVKPYFLASSKLDDPALYSSAKSILLYLLHRNVS